MNKNVILFGDNKKICHELKSKLFKLGINAEIWMQTGKKSERFTSKLITDTENSPLILVFKNEDLKCQTELLYKNGITELYVCPWDTHYVDNDNFDLSSCVIYVDNSKPRLDHVEIELSESCNLNCKGCFQFSNLAAGKNFPDLLVFKNDLMKLRDFFWGIGKIKLLGGEPLLNNDFLSFIKAAREIFPDSDIRLVTNGLLLPSLTKAELAEIKQNNCIVDISNYPPTQKKIDSITALLKNAGVSFTVSLPINIFFKSLLPNPSEFPDTAFSNCIFTHCHALANGKLAACTHQFYIERFNTEFALNYPADEPGEVINIYNSSLDGWKINEIFDNPRDFCRYCSTGMVPFTWKTALRGNAKPSDWIVKGTFTNKKIIPFFQNVMKAYEKQLRHFIQRPRRDRR